MRYQFVKKVVTLPNTKKGTRLGFCVDGRTKNMSDIKIDLLVSPLDQTLR